MQRRLADGISSERCENDGWSGEAIRLLGGIRVGTNRDRSRNAAAGMDSGGGWKVLTYKRVVERAMFTTPSHWGEAGGHYCAGAAQCLAA